MKHFVCHIIKFNPKCTITSECYYNVHIIYKKHCLHNIYSILMKIHNKNTTDLICLADVNDRCRMLDYSTITKYFKHLNVITRNASWKSWNKLFHDNEKNFGYTILIL